MRHGPRHAAVWRRVLLAVLSIAWVAAAAEPVPLGLHDVLAAALARDPQVTNARAQSQIARAQHRQLRSRFWPSAGVSASYGRSTDVDPPTQVDRTTSRSEAFLRWNLFNGFADHTQLTAQQLELDAAEADLRRALDEACDRVGQAYFELLRQQQLAGHAGRRLVEVQALVGRVARQAELGKGSDADAQLAAASLIDARLALEAVQSDLAAAQVQVGVLMGSAAALQVLPEPLPLPPALAEASLDDWRALAQARNGQWLAAATRAEAARARIGPVPSDYLPRIDLDLRKRLSDRTAPATTSAQQRGWSVSLTYEVPLGGAPAARRDESRARAEAAEAELQRVADTVQAELGASRQQALQAAAAAPQLARQREHLDAVVRASELQYDAGRRSLMQLIEQRDRRFGVQQREVDNTWRQALAHLRLQLLGGGLAQALGVLPLP